MDAPNLWNISLQQIRIFLKAVELRNFSKTAAQLNFTPSMVSKTIQSLEDTLGLELFVRKPNELVPTRAALQLAKDWRLLLGSVHNSVVRAKALENDALPHLVIGFVDSSELVDGQIREAIRAFREQYPEYQVIVEKHDMHRSAELLESGMLDLIYTSAIEVPYLEKHALRWEKVLDTRAAAFVPKGHSLYGRENLQLQDLANTNLCALDPQMHPSYTKWLNDLCAGAGFIPRVTVTFRTVRSLRFSLSVNPEVFIGETITGDWADGDLRVFPLQERSFTLLGWRDQGRRELLILKDMLKKGLQI